MRETPVGFVPLGGDTDMLRLVWNIDPVLLQVGPLQLRWYGLLFAAGMLAAYRAGLWSFERAGGSREEASRLLGYVVAGTVVGARLGHCLLYEPGYYLNHPLEILAVWRGGLASHGGAAGIILAVWVYAGRTGRNVLWLLDRVAVAAPVAAACIRIGNLFNSEIVGRPSAVRWAVVFARLDPYPRHPAMLYEATAYLVIFAAMLSLERYTRLRERPAALTGIVLVADLWLPLRHRVSQGAAGGVRGDAAPGYGAAPERTGGAPGRMAGRRRFPPITATCACARPPRLNSTAFLDIHLTEVRLAVALD